MSDELKLTEKIENDVMSKNKDSSFVVVETPDETQLEVVEQKPLVNLSSSKEEIVERMQETTSIDELKDLTNLFGISLTKRDY